MKLKSWIFFAQFPAGTKVALVPGVAVVPEALHSLGVEDLGVMVRENFLTNFGKSCLAHKP